MPKPTRNHFRRIFKSQLWGLLWYSITSILLVWLLIAIFPSLKSVDINQLMAAMPKQFVQLFGGGDALSANTIEGLLAFKYLAIFFVIMAAFHFAGAAGNAVAGAIENRTLDFSLSQPIARTKYLLAEMAAAALTTGGLVWVTALAIYLFGLIYHVTINSAGIGAFAVVGTAFLWCWLGVSFLLTTFLPSRSGVVIGTFILIMVAYLLTALADLSDKIKTLSHYSVFQYYKPQELLHNGLIHWDQVGVLLGIGLVCAVGSLIIFNRRDV